MIGLVILQSQGWDVLMERLSDMAAGAEQGAINLLLALAVALVGWGVATLLAWVTRVILRAARFNDAMTGMLGPTAAGRHEPAVFASWMVYWVLIAVTVMLALDTLGFNISALVSERLAEVLPRIVAAGAIVAVGLMIAMLIGAMARRFFETAGMRGAKPRGQAVTGVLVIFTVLLALDQIGRAHV